MPRITSTSTPDQIRDAYRSRDGVVGCHVDAFNAPPEARISTQVAHDKAIDELPEPRFGNAAGHLAGKGDGKLCLPFRALYENDPESFQVTQAGPNCSANAARRAAGIGRSTEIASGDPDAETGKRETYQGRDSSAVAYRARGNNGAGMPIVTACRALMDYGFALEQTYCDGRYDFSTEAKGYQWAAKGARGMPDDLIEAIHAHRFRSVAFQETMEEVRASIFGGYCPMVGSTLGIGPRPIGEDFLSQIVGRENHARTIEGFDDRREHHYECLYFIGNSWGAWNIRPTNWPEEYGPWIPGISVLTESDTWRLVSQRSCWVGSSALGFPAQRPTFVFA